MVRRWNGWEGIDFYRNSFLVQKYYGWNKGFQVHAGLCGIFLFKTIIVYLTETNTQFFYCSLNFLIHCSRQKEGKNEGCFGWSNDFGEVITICSLFILVRAWYIGNHSQLETCSCAENDNKLIIEITMLNICPFHSWKCFQIWIVSNIFYFSFCY